MRRAAGWPAEGRPLFAAAYGAVSPALVDVVSANVAGGPMSPSTRFWHAVYDVGLFVALGMAIDLLSGALAILARGRRLAFVPLYGGLAAIAAYGLLERSFSRQADVAFDGQLSGPLLVAMTLAAGMAAPALDALGHWLGRRRFLFFAGLTAGLAGAVVNVCVFRDDYVEAHAAVAICAAILCGRSIAPRISARLGARASPSAVLLAVRAVAFTAAVTAVVAPSNAVRLALFRSPGPAGAWIGAFYVWGLPELSRSDQQRIPPRWLEPRREGSRPPSQVRLAGDRPIVVLVTVDALRADVLLDDERSTSWPTFAKLKQEGAVFTRARSPGSQTSVSLTATFAGKYFSEMRWEKAGTGRSRFEYAAIDPTPRFTDLLRDAGVATYKVASLTFLQNEFGVASGFEEEELVTEGRRHARAGEVVPPLVARLRRPGTERLFAFAHLTEPHAPYDRGKVKEGPAFDRYLSEIQEADLFLGRIVRALAAPQLANRAVLVVTSDHGEAFGEHGTHQHTKTIYEELVRVPLLVWGAGVAPRRIDEPVSLLDLGPTVLDIFGVPTPDDVTAESLVPILAGQDAPLGRPIFAEGRLRRAYFDGDTKVIVDLRRKTIEAYDLAADPRELVNLYDRDPARVAPQLAALGAFFDARTFREGGYEPIYKP